MENKNGYDHDNDIEYEEKSMVSLSDSDIDEMKEYLKNMNVRDVSEEYR